MNVNMSDYAYGRNSPLSWWDSVKMSGCAYGSSSPVGQVMSVSKAFLLLVRVRLANKSRLVLVGAAVSLVRLLSTATVVFRAVVRLMADTSTELPHRTLQIRHLKGALPGCSAQGVLVRSAICLAVLMGAVVPLVRSCQSPRTFCFLSE